MGEEKYTIAEEFELPSKGLIYGKEVNPRVKLRSMTMRDEMRRTSRTDRPNILLAEIIEGCMVEKPTISVCDMCLGDFEYLLHKLRVVSQGEIYEMSAMCPFCGEMTDIKVNLDEEKVLEYKEGDWEELLTLRLPVCGKEVTLNFHTPRIIDTIKAKAEDMKKKSKENLDFEKLARLEESIALVDGVKLNYIQKENFVKNLSLRDGQKILKRIDKINKSIGIDPDMKFTCGKCGEEVLTFFRYTSEFFDPADDE